MRKFAPELWQERNLKIFARQFGIGAAAGIRTRALVFRLESVRSFARAVLEMEAPVHCLVNNAGIMFGPRRETEDGWVARRSLLTC